MMRAFAVFLLLAASVVGQEIVGPDTVATSSPAWFEITGLQSGQAAMFWPEQYLQAGPPHLRDLHALFWVRKSGSYAIRGVVVRIEMVDGKPVPYITPMSHTVVVKGADPDPDPDPDPNPNPNPNPGPTTSLWGLLLYEPSQLDNQPNVAKMVVSQRLRGLPGFRLEPVSIHAIDETGDEPDELKQWLDLTRNQGWVLPRLLLINQDGDLVKQIQATTIDAAIAEIKEIL